MYRTPRYFSLSEANAALPRLREIFDRAKSVRDRAQALVDELREKDALPEEDGEVDESAPAPVQKKQAELRDRLAELGALVEEVYDLGAEVKAADGLVDFRTRRLGRTVYLCWRFGEDKITHWHDLESGFAGRQAIGSADEFVGGLLH